MAEPPAKRLKTDPAEKMQKYIKNCKALTEVMGRSYVYTTAELEYSRIWTKEDVLDDEPIYYYYRIQIVGMRKDGHDDEGNYMFTQNWGAFDTINHRKRSDYLPLMQCIKKFVIQSAERNKKLIFAKIKENDISKYPLPESVQELIAEYIFEMNFFKKMINEYTFDVKSTISEFLNATPQFQYAESYTYISYNDVRALLNQVVTCQPTDKKEGNSRFFSLMNFFYKQNEGNSRTFSLMNFYYTQLHTKIRVLDTQTERYKVIEKYFINSQSSQHHFYSLQLKEVFEIERPSDNHRYTKDLKNKQLLWHGTHTHNIPSILYEGFRTSKARSTGMFGAGTYFANSVSKSLLYSGKQVLLLCEVALGDTMRCTHSCNQPLNADGTLPNGKNSVHGIGSRTPDINDYTVIDGEVLVPYGKLESKKELNNHFLMDDEFIVYNTAQIKIRYLITAKFQRTGMI